MEDIVVEVASATSCKAFIPFTALPNDYAGKTVRIVLYDEQSQVDEIVTQDLFDAVIADESFRF